MFGRLLECWEQTCNYCSCGGKVVELEQALALAQRGQLANWITRVQIHHSIISLV
jgi:hypothetical protein